MKIKVLVKTMLLVLVVFCSIGFAGQFKVLRVVDGDTIDIDFNGTKERVRMLCVDTPESVHPDRSRNTPLGSAASLYTKNSLTGKTIDLEFEGRKRGHYKRLLAYVFVDNTNFNLDLVKKGFSPYYTKYGKSKSHDLEFKKAELSAKEQALNIWSQKAITTPTPARTAALDIKLFHGNRASRIFHKPSCRYFNCTHCTEIFQIRAEAISSGFKPCNICKP